MAGVEPVAEAVYEGQYASFTVRLSEGEPTAPVKLSYSVAGTATEGVDYIAPRGTLTIPAGQQFGTISIRTLFDDTVDPDETVVVELTDATSVGRDVEIPADTATAATTILDGSAVSVTVAASQAAEGDEVQFAVTLSAPMSVPVNVDWETREFRGDLSQDRSATLDIDYKNSSGTATIAPGETSTKLNVATIEDAIAEGNELFEVILAGATRRANPDTAQELPLGVFTAVGQIVDNDDPPDTVTLTATPSTVAEDTGEAELSITATFDGTVSLAVDTPVSVTVADGTATEGDDYTAAAATLTIPAGQLTNTGTLTLALVDDTVAEGSETVQVTGTSAGLDVTPAEVTISDNDAQPSGVILTVTPDQVDEGEGPTDLIVSARLTGGSTSSVDTPVALTVTGAALPLDDGTTTAATAADFTATEATLTIPAGALEGTATLTVTPTDDAIAEGDETVQVDGSAVGLTVTAAAVTITDNDDEPSRIELSVKPLEVDEGNGPVDLAVTAALTGGGSRTVDTSILLSVHGLTATAGDDYSAPSDVTLTVPAGGATGTAVLTLAVVDDDLHEGEEQLAVRGSNADPGLPVVGVRIAIADDDTAPTGITLSMETNRIAEDAGLQELAVTATLEGGGIRTADTRVMLSASSVTTSDADYSAWPVVLMIESNQRRGTATMLLVPMDDSIDEDDEILEVRGATADLGLPVFAQQVTITDNDTAAVRVDPTEL